MDGNLFLSLKDDDSSWDDLELNVKYEELLKQCKNT